jgi:peptidoglycan/LPS O-acetylase OafA/YrhL
MELSTATVHTKPETTRVQKLTYRADIDGLRAVAVLLVVACHSRIHLFSGGFVGVDVFFVISGFLISSIILSQIQSGKFSLSGFYERRIRRILPALVGVILATCILAWRFLLPTEMEDFARSLLAAIFSVSNVYFWTQSGYFDAPAASKPLLHTWSLGVEEQFYLIFPLLLYFLRRVFPRRLQSAVIALAVVTFIASVVQTFHAPESAFYLAQYRAWELLLGTILSMQILPQITHRWLREGASAIGLLLIFFAGLTYTPQTPFPGLSALAPCLGAAAIIAAGQAGPSLAGRLLSTKPMVFIGLISYSLYLWHWPIIVFQGIGHILVGTGSVRSIQVVGVIASLIAGYLSWRWIELPFRGGKLKLSGAPLFSAAAAAVACIAIAAGSALWAHGFTSRFSPQATLMGAYLDYKSDYREGTCFITTHNTYADYKPSVCLSAVSGKKNYLLIGDSHAAQLWHGLAHVLPDVNVMQATASGCRPVLRNAAHSSCTQLIDFIYSSYLPSHHVDRLLLAARWEPQDLPQLAQTIAWAQQNNIPVTLFGPIVEYDTALPRLLVAALSKNDPSIPDRHQLTAFRQLDTKMQQLADGQWHVRYLSYYRTLCQAGRCVEYVNGDVPLQFDVSHLTDDGSIFAIQQFVQQGQLP